MSRNTHCNLRATGSHLRCTCVNSLYEMGWEVHRSVKICSHALSSRCCVKPRWTIPVECEALSARKGQGKIPEDRLWSCRSFSSARSTGLLSVAEYVPTTSTLQEKRRNPKIQQQRQPIVKRRDQRPRSHSRINPQCGGKPTAPPHPSPPPAPPPHPSPHPHIPPKAHRQSTS